MPEGVSESRALKRFNRRKFLREFGATVAGAGLGTALGLSGLKTATEIMAVSSSKKSKETKTPPTFSSQECGQLRFYFSPYGLPFRYTDQDRKETFFTKEEVKGFAHLQQAAVRNQEPEVAAQIETGSDSLPLFPEHQASAEHPLITEIPEDVLSEEKLAKRGIQIIQAERVKLHIRPGAFEEGEPFESLTPDGKRKLIIALVDAPVLKPKMKETRDPAYDPIRPLLVSLNEPRLKKEQGKAILKTEKAIEEVRQELKRAIEARTPVSQYHQQVLLDFKSKLFSLRHPTEPAEGDALGRYITSAGVSLFGGWRLKPKTSVILLAVGDPKPSTPERVEIYFDAKGKPQLRKLPQENYFLVGNIPNPEQTHPNPGQFPLNLEADPKKRKSYLLARSPTTGFTLRHESAHFFKTDSALDRLEWPDLNEYRTDLMALETIQKAWEKWVKSGYKDNSGYYFVFETSEGYILTKKEKEQPTTGVI